MTTEEYYMFRILMLERLYLLQQQINDMVDKKEICLIEHIAHTINITSEINYISQGVMYTNFSQN